MTQILNSLSLILAFATIIFLLMATQEVRKFGFRQVFYFLIMMFSTLVLLILNYKRMRKHLIAAYFNSINSIKRIIFKKKELKYDEDNDLIEYLFILF